ncbi:hypothetical protein P280DRAFT_541300 [Massarina eburnea CBS 473.64]|uniref:Uncharacterized protein n=1 Tax=Massarina eburnea CBS 473.64 TaxID=1395130 RepID=A0A6A6S554_9PLEO|nr:hypothetical protein P280DRAFT_541300 [Massarina eburnea CBS 473.64]
MTPKTSKMKWKNHAIDMYHDFVWRHGLRDQVDPTMRNEIESSTRFLDRSTTTLQQRIDTLTYTPNFLTTLRGICTDIDLLKHLGLDPPHSLTSMDVRFKFAFRLCKKVMHLINTNALEALNIYEASIVGDVLLRDIVFESWDRDVREQTRCLWRELCEFHTKAGAVLKLPGFFYEATMSMLAEKLHQELDAICDDYLW